MLAAVGCLPEQVNWKTDQRNLLLSKTELLLSKIVTGDLFWNRITTHYSFN